MWIECLVLFLGGKGVEHTNSFENLTDSWKLFLNTSLVLFVGQFDSVYLYNSWSSVCSCAVMRSRRNNLFIKMFNIKNHKNWVITSFIKFNRESIYQLSFAPFRSLPVKPDFKELYAFLAVSAMEWVWKFVQLYYFLTSSETFHFRLCSKNVIHLEVEYSFLRFLKISLFELIVFFISRSTITFDLDQYEKFSVMGH